MVVSSTTSHGPPHLHTTYPDSLEHHMSPSHQLSHSTMPIPIPIMYLCSFFQRTDEPQPLPISSSHSSPGLLISVASSKFSLGNTLDTPTANIHFDDDPYGYAAEEAEDHLFYSYDDNYDDYYDDVMMMAVHGPIHTILVILSMLIIIIFPKTRVKIDDDPNK